MAFRRRRRRPYRRLLSRLTRERGALRGATRYNAQPQHALIAVERRQHQLAQAGATMDIATRPSAHHAAPTPKWHPATLPPAVRDTVRKAKVSLVVQLTALLATIIIAGVAAFAMIEAEDLAALAVG